MTINDDGWKIILFVILAGTAWLLGLAWFIDRGKDGN